MSCAGCMARVVGASALGFAALCLPGCGPGSARHGTVTTPSAPDAAQLYAAGAVFAARGDDVRAEQYLNAARRAPTDDRRVLPALVALCVRASRLRAALGYALEDLRQRPEDFRLGFLIASLHAALEQPADALRMLERVVQLRPDWPHAHYLRARLYRDSFADYVGASLAFRAYLQCTPAALLPHEAQEARAFLALHPAPSRPAQRGRR
jgi:tetratricopeptide (TPR) repeat protein